MTSYRTRLREKVAKRSERTWGSSLLRSLAAVLAGTVLSGVVYNLLLALSQRIPFVFQPNTASVAVYAVAILSVAISYGVNRGVVPTYLLALQVSGAAFYYDVRFHSGGIVDTPLNLTVRKAVPVALICWGIGVLLASLANRSLTSR